MTNITNKPITRNTMSDLERVLYDLAEAGLLDATRARLYARPVAKLERAGLLAPKPQGGYAAVKTGSMPPPAGEPMATLVCRVPQSWVDTLDALGPNRSEAARAMLGKALASASGQRRRVVA